jgi:hypothetical protein
VEWRVSKWNAPRLLCITDTRYGYGDTAIREFEKQYSFSIEKVSKYRSIIRGFGWVGDHRRPAAATW